MFDSVTMLDDLKINLKEPSNTVGCPEKVASFLNESKIKRLKLGDILDVFQVYSRVGFQRLVLT